MNQYTYHATNLITECLDSEELHYTVKADDKFEEIIVPAPIDLGPIAEIRFISADNDNDVAVRLFNLVNCIPESMAPRIMELCNLLNNKVRFIKFYYNSQNNFIAIEYDIPLRTDDACLGKVAVELFHRIVNILDNEYPTIVKALFTKKPLSGKDSIDEEDKKQPDEEPTSESLHSTLKLLRRLREAHERAGAHSEADNEESSGDDE